MHNYEIEIKSFLGSKEKADELRNRLVKRFPLLQTLPRHKQRNHYFNAPPDLTGIENVAVSLYPSKAKRAELSRILQNVKGDISIRTREADGAVSFILKASIGDDSSANGVSRIEFEEPVKLSLEQLDKKLLDAGLSYQAKWSREREEYKNGNTHITIDKNAGYGYLAEFEQIVNSMEKTDEARRELSGLMYELGVSELPQDRLERMFAHYNKNFEKYYGTDKVFVVE